jgi:hypothetical protein
VQQPRIPIWVAGGWPAARGAFRRAARFDGVYPMPSDPSERFYLVPDELRAVREAIGRGDDYELLATAYPDADPDELAAAGATWWVQVCSSRAEAMARARAGPPGSNGR